MLPDEWQLGLVAAAVLVNAALAYRLRREALGSTPESGTAGSVDATADVVECPACGAGNDSGYRYCRACVEQLPGEFRYGGTTPRPIRRFTR